MWTHDSALAAMKSIDPSPAFILHGGDAYPHADGKATDVILSVYNSTHKIREFFPNTPVIYALGNHDVHPCHCILPSSEWLKNLAEIALRDILNE